MFLQELVKEEAMAVRAKFNDDTLYKIAVSAVKVK